MPLTFIEIEKQKNWRIAALFIVLLFLYFIIALGLFYSLFEMFSLGNLLQKGFPFRLGQIATIFFFSFIIASVHFYFSAYDSVARIKNTVGGTAADPGDEIHKRLMNIMEEIHVVTGSRVKMECVVIPTLSMNALSAVDLKGNAMVAITEGLLSRLSREQTEAVMAHEAYHIVSGDCLEGTVATSLFGLPASVMEKVQSFSEGRVFFSPAFIFSFMLLKLSYLLNMFISREREYRADAGSVRMTRNPLALAEVLHLLSRNWRGAGFIGSGLEALCIMNPRARGLDESEGLVPDLLSTHPPIRKRIGILLAMAKVSITEFDGKRKVAGTAGSAGAQPAGLYFALDTRYQWQGPFTFAELAALPWFSALTWISNGGGTMEKASAIPGLSDIFMQRVASEENVATGSLCPICRHPLVVRSFEKTQVSQCTFCGGTMIDNDKISRVLARSDGGCPDRIKALARDTMKENQIRSITRKTRGEEQKMPLLHCPKCGNNMTRTFYSLAYLVEIDRCSWCDISWFDRDELAILQCMISTRMASENLLGKEMPIQ